MCLLNKKLRFLPYISKISYGCPLWHHWLNLFVKCCSFTLQIPSHHSSVPFQFPTTVNVHGMYHVAFHKYHFLCIANSYHYKNVARIKRQKWAISGLSLSFAFFICKTPLAEIITGTKRKADCAISEALSSVTNLAF